MRVLNYQASDAPQVAAWFEGSGFAYVRPNLDEKQFISKKMVLDGALPVGAAAARLTVEIYGYLDPTWGTPAMKLEALRLLHREIGKELRAQGIHDVHAWLPPEIAQTFGRRLMKTFGWWKPDWPCFSKAV